MHTPNNTTPSTLERLKGQKEFKLVDQSLEVQPDESPMTDQHNAR
jgi:hypothetical protein